MSKSAALPPLHIFATIGSTRFDDLVAALLSPKLLGLLASFSVAGSTGDSDRALFERVVLTVQHGATPVDTSLANQATRQADTAVSLTGEAQLRQRGVGSVSPSTKKESGINDGSTGKTPLAGLELRLFDYAPSIRSHLEAADIVISHAGSGTVLEVLRLPEPASTAVSRALSPSILVVVPNRTLADDHQAELATALAKDSYLIQSEVESIERTILELLLAVKSSAVLTGDSSGEGSRKISTRPTFPPFAPERFRNLVDEEMGFV